MKTFFNLLLLSAFSLSFSLNANAQNILENDQYVVHYNAFNSTFIDPIAAKQNKLVRSKYTAMLNIAVHKKLGDKTTKAISSILTGSVENLVGQQQTLTFVKIKEGDAIYYIASFKFVDQEQMNFSVDVQPDPNKAPIKLTLSQKFYVD